MRSLLKTFALSLIAITLVFSPMASVDAKSLSTKSGYSKYKKSKSKYSKRKKVSYKKAKARRAKRAAQRAAIAEQRAIDLGENYDGSTTPNLASAKVLVINQDNGEVKFAKNSDTKTPIASITKLMTAMVVLDADQPLDEIIYISEEDVDTIKGTRSRLPVGTGLSRAVMLKLSLMSSENRAAYALSTNYPGGRPAFINAMNRKAELLGLSNTHFVEPTGLMYQNVSTAEDLYRLVATAHQYPEIRQSTTMPEYYVYLEASEEPTRFRNTNSLVRLGGWDIGLSKTGYINEAGRCLVMQAHMGGEPIIVVLLDAEGSNKRTGDMNRVRKWIEYNNNINLAKEETEYSPKLVMTDEIYEVTRQ